MLYLVISTFYIEHTNEATKQKRTMDSLVCSTVCIRLPFEIQISHNYSDLIVLKCVELMTRDKKRVLFTKAINRSCPIKRKSFVLRLAK